MHKLLAIGAIAAVALSCQAFAADNSSALSYNYLEAGYVNEHIDGLAGHNPDGAGIRGSVALAPMFHAYAEYSNLEYSHITLQSYEVGVGLNFSLSPTVDLIGRAGYARAKIESLGSDDGFSVRAGVRTRLADVVELEGLVHYVNLDDAGHNTSAELAARYHFTPQFAVGVGLEYDNDAQIYTAGVRYTFK